MDYLISILRDYLPEAQAMQTAFLLLVGLAVFVVVLAVLYLLAGMFDPMQSRLRRLTGEDKKKKPVMANVSQALKPITQMVEPEQQSSEHSRLQKRLLHAGFRNPNAPSMFYSLKVLSLVFFPAIAFIATLFAGELSSGEMGYLLLAGAAIGFMVPNLILTKLVNRHQKRLRDGFPDALDLLVVCAEAGLGLKAAIQRVADEISISHEELAIELNTVNAEMRAGMENITALRNLVERTGLTEVRGLVVMLSQSMRFGTSVAETLRIYADEFREKRMQLAEEKAAQISIKLLFPLALCFLPALLIVGVGPAILGVIKVFQ